MDVVVYAVVIGSIGTAISLYLLFRIFWLERSALLPYMTNLISIFEHEGHLIIKLGVMIQNRSRGANTVRRILLEARQEKDFCFEPSKFDFHNDGKAYVNYEGNKIEGICSAEDALILPVNIEGKQSSGGWLGFVISPELVDKVKSQKWCIKVFDESGKSFLSTSDRDQTISV